MSFDDAWDGALEATMFGETVRVLSHGALVLAKRAAIAQRDDDAPKRAQDIADLAWLESLAPKKRKR